MVKEDLIIDFDGCIGNSVKRIVSLYDSDYRLYPDYKQIHWTVIDSWNFEELTLISREHINHYFEQERFFDNKLDFMENAKEVITKLSERFNISVCTMGFGNNLKFKEAWLRKHFPFLKEFIGVDMREYENKSHIDMSDAIFIDDCSNNLVTSSAKKKILYGDDYSWNRGYEGLRCWNWTEVEKELIG